MDPEPTRLALAGALHQAKRNERVEKSSRCKPEAGLAILKRWMSQHKLAKIVELKLQERQIVEGVHEEAKHKSLELAGRIFARLFLVNR